MMTFMKLLYILLALSVTLTACGVAPQAAATPAPASSSNTLSKPTAVPATIAPEVATPTPAQTEESGDQSSSNSELVRIDEQGAIIVEVTPVNIENPGEALEFEVALNTHSVDLSMDLAPLATLATDSGKTVQALQWDAPKGGHHVSGKLIFPATMDGQPILEGTKNLTLTIKGLDAPERVFSWDLSR